MLALPLTLQNLGPVALAMREWDRREVFATRGDDDGLAFAHAACALTRLGMVAAGRDGEPVAALGAVPLHPGVFAVWMIATDAWPSVALPVTRWIHSTFAPLMVEAGAHRVEARSIDGHTVAHRFLEHCGAVRESTQPLYGRNRETFHLYVWTR